jgi:hypothetical protein
MAGLIVTANDVNNTVGDISRAIDYQMRRSINLKRFLDRFTAQDLFDKFGIPLADANLIKSAVGELATINTTFQANRSFIDQVEGLGDV